MAASRDLGLHFSNKLSADWSAGNVTSLLSPEVLEHLLSRWESLDTLVRARLLLSPLFLRKKDLKDLQPVLQQMAEVGCGDRDEWVRVLARAVGSYDGRLHLDAVLKDSKLVGKTLNELRQLLETADPTIFRPLEELYLNSDIRESLVGPRPSAMQHQHFRARSASDAPSARQPGAAAAAPQRGAVAAAAVQMAGGSHWAPRVSRAPSSAPQADLFLPSKPVQRLASGLHSASSGPLFVGSSGGARGLGGGGAAAAKPKRLAMIDPEEVKRMNEAAQKERERKAQEEKAAREAEARQRAAQRAAEKAAKVELKRKRSGAPASLGEQQPSAKTPRTTDNSEVPQAEQQQQQQQCQQEPQQQQQVAAAGCPAAVVANNDMQPVPQAAAEGPQQTEQAQSGGGAAQQEQI